MGSEGFGAHPRIVGVDEVNCPDDFLYELGAFSLRPEVSVHNIMAFGDRAYIAYYQDGLRVLDLSDPTAPALAGWYNTWDGRVGASFYEAACGIDVDLARRRLFVADTARGLLIFSDDLP
jgi:hypothetical protein